MEARQPFSRLGWALFSILGGSGVLAYIIAAIIIPNDPVEPMY